MLLPGIIYLTSSYLTTIEPIIFCPIISYPIIFYPITFCLISLPPHLILLILTSLYTLINLSYHIISYRPSLAYLDPIEGGSNLELWIRRRPIDENDPELSTLKRSVLLFNTWREAPFEVSTDPPSSEY